MIRSLVLLLALSGCAPLMEAKAKDEIIRLTPEQLREALQKAYYKGRDASNHDTWCRKVL